MFVLWGPRHASLRDVGSKLALVHITARHADDAVAASSLHVLNADQLLRMRRLALISVCRMGISDFRRSGCTSRPWRLRQCSGLRNRVRWARGAVYSVGDRCLVEFRLVVAQCANGKVGGGFAHSAFNSQIFVHI